MPVPPDLVAEVEAKRAELVERISEVDDEIQSILSMLRISRLGHSSPSEESQWFLMYASCAHATHVQVAELFLNEQPIEPAVLRAAIRRATLALKFQPVLMGSAFKNKGAPLALCMPTPMLKSTVVFACSCRCAGTS
eukprot:scaffold234910_cov17-Tisochrysis_lutea.AAC.1